MNNLHICSCCKNKIVESEIKFSGLQEDHLGVVRWGLFTHSCRSTIAIPIEECMSFDNFVIKLQYLAKLLEAKNKPILANEIRDYLASLINQDGKTNDLLDNSVCELHAVIVELEVRGLRKEAKKLRLELELLLKEKLALFNEEKEAA